MQIKRVLNVIVPTVISLAALQASVRADDALKVTTADVTVVCPLTIGGSFEAKTTALSGEIAPASQGALKGAFTVQLMKLETGITLRDRHLRNNYLEVQKGPDYAVAKMENLRIERLPGKTTFRGTLKLHGQEREVNGVADVQGNEKGYKVEASFPLKISDFQIPEPTYLGVGVQDDITIKVVMNTAPAAAGVPTRTGGGQ